MKHTIEKTASGLRVTAAVDADKQSALLEEFNKCAAGTCSCPTPQYGKLEAIDVKTDAGRVSVDLRAKPGEVIDTQNIERSLEHTAKLTGA